MLSHRRGYRSGNLKMSLVISLSQGMFDNRARELSHLQEETTCHLGIEVLIRQAKKA